MKRFSPITAIVFCTALWFVACDKQHAVLQEATKLSPEEQEQNECEGFQNRFVDHKSWLTGASFALRHCATEDGFKVAKETVDLLDSLETRDQISTLVETEGWRPFKNKVAKLLQNPDPVIRGFGAVWLFVVGGAEYKNDIAKLLDDKPSAPANDEERLFYNFDRSVAARALGRMGAKEYAPRLVAILGSSDEHDRSGAVLGLGYLGAKEHVKEIAQLLSDDSEMVQISAIQILSEFDARKYAEEIANLLTQPLISSDVKDAAGYALVRLNGKPRTKHLAALYFASLLQRHSYRKGEAAKVLALLRATEYSEQIARLMDDGKAGERCDALIALGILNAKEYRTNIAMHLQDEETFVRAYAAVALLMMRDQTYSREILDVIHAEWKVPEFASIANNPAAHFSARIAHHSSFGESHQQLTNRAVEAWNRINRSKE